MVINHTRCGMLTFTDDDFRRGAAQGDRQPAGVGRRRLLGPRPERARRRCPHQGEPLHPAHRQRAGLRLRAGDRPPARGDLISGPAGADAIGAAARRARRSSEAPDSGRRDPRVGDRLHRQHRRERRPAGDSRRPRRRPCDAAVGRRVLPAGARGADPPRRLAVGRPGTAPRVPRRRRRLRRHVAAVRGRPERDAPGDRARTAGRRRRAAGPQLARDHRRHLPRVRTGPRDRVVDRVGGGGHGHRPGGRGCARGRRVLALGLRPQCPADRNHARDQRTGAVTAAGPSPASARRRPRRAALRRGPRGSRARADRAADARLG